MNERFVFWRALAALLMLAFVWPVCMAVQLPGMLRAVRRGRGATRASLLLVVLLCAGCASSPTRGMSEDKKLIHGGYGAAWDVPVEMIEVPK